MLLLFLACADWKLDEGQDLDGDGYSIAMGDCWDDPRELLSTGLTGTDIHPDAEEIWYDGVDQNCDGADDLDQDGDGHRKLGASYPSEPEQVGDDCADDPSVEVLVLNGFPSLTATDIHPEAVEQWYDGVDQDCGDGVEYHSVSESDFDQDGDGAPCQQNSPADADGYCTGDCDDQDPTLVPNSEPEAVWYDGIDNNCDGNDVDQDGDGHAWVGNVAGKVPANMSMDDCEDDPNIPLTVLNEFSAVTAAEVHPGVKERYYDGIDQDCDSANDFDQDQDGQQSLYYENERGLLGSDCFDDETDVANGYFVNNGGLAPQNVNSAATEVWYDGTDQDCSGGSDFDQDKDGFDSDHYGGSDCDDHTDLVAPDVVESCDTPSDDNCNGTTNEQNALNSQPYYQDLDGDGFGAGAPEYWCAGGDSASDYTATTDTDCDDSDAFINPGEQEICDADNTDEDCSGLADDADPQTVGTLSWYNDGDGDGFGNPSSRQIRCEMSPNEVSDGTDCDDMNKIIYPGASEITADSVDQNCDGVDTCYEDADNDNYGGTALVSGSSLSCSSGTGAPTDGDCDDTSSSVNPGAAEVVADGIDQDCNRVDTCYSDSDGDNYGSTSTTEGTSLDCDSGTGSPNQNDCDDLNAAINPKATETVADGVDQDCDGTDACYLDADGDNYGSNAVVAGSSLDCDSGSGSTVSTDCDDIHATIYPGATETIADGLDQDCDGVDSCYTDADGDNYGTTTVSDGSSLNCTTGAGATVSTDCDDTASAIHPGAQEVCDAVHADEDCNGLADDEDANTLSSGKQTYYEDDDGDGYGISTGGLSRCTAPSGYVRDSSDCDDTDAFVYPGGTEYCDNKNNDCTNKSWSTANENNLVTRIDSLSPSATLVTATNIHTNLGWSTTGIATQVGLTGGTASAPNQINVCTPTSGDARYHVYLEATTASTYTNITGMYSTIMTLDASGSNHSVLAVLDSGYGIGLDLAYLKLTGGSGSGSIRYGGGILLQATSDAETEVSLSNCELTGNTADYGAAINLGGGSTSASGLRYGDLILSDTRIYGNSASAYGGGLYLYARGGSLSCTASSTAYGIYQNGAPMGGGGAYLDATASAGTILVSSGCFWGTTGSSNAPSDVDGANFSGAYAVANSGTSSFSCDYSHCY